MKLVLDANILIRAVLGSQVSFLLRKYFDQVLLVTPDIAFVEAETHLPRLLGYRAIPVAQGMAMLDFLHNLVNIIQLSDYADFENVARQRLDRRDPDDWPMVAAALTLDCPIWTEDTDFFGCGVATWTSDRVEMFLSTSKIGS